MVAAAIGDTLGWPNEMVSKNKIKRTGADTRFIEWSRTSRNPRWHSETIKAGEYSDDTQLTLSVARSLISEDWEKSLSEKELPFWLEYERGGGGALLRAASCWKDKGLPLWKTEKAKRYYNAGGNGAAMRILPHVIANATIGNIGQLIEDIFFDSILTHGHPRAILGAMCYGYALDYLLNKKSILEYGELVSAVIDGQEEWSRLPTGDNFLDWFATAQRQSGFDYVNVWSETSLRMLNQLEYLKQSLKKGLMVNDETIMNELGAFGEAKGAGDVGVLCAIFLISKYSNNLQLAITVPAFSYGADTDTIGAMTGGLAGMLSGLDWIPLEWKSVQDYDCLIQMADLLLSDNKIDATRVVVSKNKSRKSECQWQSSPIGNIRLIDTTNATNGKKGIVEINKWETAIGQSIYLKQYIPFNHEVANNSLRENKQLTLFDTNCKPAKDGNSDLLHNCLILDENAIHNIICCPSLKRKMTVGKALEIISCILSNSVHDNDISKKYDIDQDMIDIIKQYIKPLIMSTQ